jgi:hypothetical protein
MLDRTSPGAELALEPQPPCAGLAALGAERSIVGDRSVGVRAYRTEDSPAVLALLRASFGRWPRGIEAASDQEFFDWKHLRSPFGASRLLVAEADGALVGFIGYMPWRLHAQGRTVTALREVDLVVYAAHRRLGVSIALRSALAFSPDVALLWGNPNAQSRPGALKLGQTELARASRFVRLARPLRAARRLARSPARPLRVEAGAAVAMLADADAADVRALTVGSSDRLTTVRDLAYLRWRYAQSGEYRAIGSAGDGAIAIFRCRRHGRARVAHICELLFEPDDARAASRLLRQVGDAADVDLLSCNFASARAAARHGFVAYPRREIVMTRVLDETLAPDPTRAGSWELSHGDIELL